MNRVFIILFSVLFFCNGINAQNLKLQNDSAIQHINTSELVTQIDSLNFAYGLSYGDSIRRYYFNNDTSGRSFFAFINAYDLVFGTEDYLKTYAEIGSEIDQGKMYKKGANVGNFITMQKSKGLMNDSTITFNQKFIEAGLIDALNDSSFFMKPLEARQFIQRKVNKSKHNSLHDRDVIEIRLLNYAYGMNIGATIKEDYIKGDSIQLKITSFIEGFIAGMDEQKSMHFQIYDLGTAFGNSLKNQIKSGLNNDSSLKVNTELVRRGLLEGLHKDFEWMSPQQAGKYLKTTLPILQNNKTTNECIQNKVNGEKFLADNAKRSGIIATASGLQYEIITKGSGALPSVSSKVKVKYQGTLIDGTVFESSMEHKDPVVLPVNQFIKGLAEALQLMPVGSKYKIFIPQELAYGNKSQDSIKPFSMLIYEIELISIEE